VRENSRHRVLGYLGNALPKTNEHRTSVVFTVYEAEWQRWKRRVAAKFDQLLSALRHMIGWMIDEEHIEPDDDPTIGLKSGKAKASRESGGWVPWTEEDMAKYRARWPLGTEARLMFDILHYTHLRLGDASRFGPEHLQRTLKTMMVRVATEKSKGRTTATLPVHRDFAVSLAAARNAGILGTGEVFTGKLVKGEIMPMNKKAWAAKFKKFARLAGVNEPKKNCHGVRKARAEVAAYSDCTEGQMMAMFGWRDHKMPALYIAKASLDKLAIGGMAKIEAYDQTENIADLAMPIDQNRIVTFESNRRKNPEISTPNVGVVRSEGLEPPRFYSLPPQGSASTNSATSAWSAPDGVRRGSRHVTNQGWRDKARMLAMPGPWRITAGRGSGATFA
jgi:integrase